MKTFVADVRYALRGLRRNVGFTIVTSASLAIGVGAATAGFSVIDALEFRPLPYRAPHELTVVGEMPRGAGSDCGSCFSSPSSIRLWHSEATSFETVGWFEQTGIRWYTGDVAERVLTSHVSHDLFTVLGVLPLRGRTFTAAETVAGARVIVLGYDFWHSRLGGDPSVIGRELDLGTSRGRERHTVIGIMPRTFRFLDNQAWLPLSESERGEERRFVAVGRLLAGVTAERAAGEVRALSAGLAAQLPATHGSSEAVVLPLREWLHDFRPHVARGRFLLFGITLFVLLVAALNVAGLLLSRARTRFHEAGVRTALGATRLRLIRQFLTESMTLAAIAGGLGFMIASAGIDVAGRMLNLSHAGFAAQLDGRVLTFALLITCLAGIGAGIVPAWYGTRGRLYASLGQRGGNGRWRGARLQTGLVVVEVACSLLLLTAGGLFANELLRLRRGEAGFDPRELYLVQASRPDFDAPQQQRAYAQTVRSELASIPGAVEIGLTGRSPLYVPLRLEGHTEPLPREESPMIALADSTLFHTIGIGPLAGRLFDGTDRFGSPPVAIVNQTAASRFWPGANPVGRRLVLGDSLREVVAVIGVVPDTKVFNAPLKQAMEPVVYRPFDQSPTPHPLFVVRGRSDARALEPALRSALARLTSAPVRTNAVVSIEAMHTLETSQERLHALSVNAFAGLGLFLAAAGIYGIVSYTTTLRRREIAVRMALGAPRPRVLLVLISEGLTIVAGGLLLGVFGSLLLARALHALLPGASVQDAWVFGGASLILATVLVLAIIVPAYRATATDLSVVLRE